MMELPLGDIASHLSSCYPAEGCGLVFQGRGALRFVPIANVAGSAEGRATSTRNLRDGYVMDARQLLAAMEAADQAGESLYAIVHSHPDVGAYLSKEDRHRAVTDEGEPLWPGVRYLVVSVRAAAVDGARLYTWNDAVSDFAEEEVPGIVSIP